MSFSVMIGAAGLLLEFSILFRAVRTSLLRRYCYFYAYIASVTLDTLTLIGVKLIAPSSYQSWYWPWNFITLVVGYGILLEMLHHVLVPYPGAERFARSSGLMAFGAIFCFALVAPMIMPHWSPGAAIEFERDMRCVQAIFICGLLAVVFYYGIPLGRNMKGMMFGYGLYILSSLVSLAVRAYAGTTFDKIWDVVQPLSFEISLAIWLVALWSYAANSAPDPGIRLEEDYEALVSKVRNRIGHVWSDLARTIRP